MFELLSDKLTGMLSRLSSKGVLTEKDIDSTLREVRMALLEADVDFKVARQLVNNVKEKAKGKEVFASLTPGQTIVKIVKEELVNVLGGDHVGLDREERPPTVVMLLGLQGTGKTTSAAKLALNLLKEEKSVMLAACDLQRPAAIEQLVQLGKQTGVPVYHEDPEKSTPVEVARNAVKQAAKQNIFYLIVDTAGRLAIDDDLMNELEDISSVLDPKEKLLVVDAMTGQDAVRSGSEFQLRIGLTGIIMTKMDGDARGGAALSMKSVTGLPIKYIGVGEKPNALEPYYPDRLASRILGMGDVETLIEKAQEQYDTSEVLQLEEKMLNSEFDLNDMLQQFRTIKKMGPLQDILGMIPGLGAMKGKMDLDKVDDRKISQVEAIILSMTSLERLNPKMINGSRRKRIADGSGTSPAQVNQLLNQHKQMQKVMKRFLKGGKKRALMGMLGQS